MKYGNSFIIIIIVQMEQLLLIYKSNIILKDICFNILLVLKDLTYHIDIFTDLLGKKKYQIASFYINADIKNFIFHNVRADVDEHHYDEQMMELVFIVTQFLMNNPWDNNIINLFNNNKFAKKVLLRTAIIYGFFVKYDYDPKKFIYFRHEGQTLLLSRVCYTKLTINSDKLRNIMMKLKHRVTENEWRNCVRDDLINEPDLHNY